MQINLTQCLYMCLYDLKRIMDYGGITVETIKYSTACGHMYIGTREPQGQNA